MTDKLDTSTGDTGAEDQGTSAETGNTEKSPMIPKARFDEVNERMKAVEADTATLREELDELRQKLMSPDKPKPADKPLVGPPRDITDPHEQALWYIKTYAPQFVEERLGMGLDQLKVVASTVPETSKQAMLMQYKSLAEKAGVDPTNKDVQKLVGRLVKAETPLDEAVTIAAKVHGTPKKKAPPRLETDGVVSALVVDDLHCDTVEEANRAAREGKRAAHRPITQILSRSKKIARK